MRGTRRVLIAGLCLGVALTMAGGCGPQAGPAGPAPSATNEVVRSGAEIYEGCLLCHSTREMQRGPIIDGLPAWYAKDQLLKFSRGIRGRNPGNKSEALMGAGMASLRHPGEIRVVAEHLSKLPPQRHRRTVRGDTEHGRAVYQTCVPCHGPRGEGNILVKGPPLRLLEDWYMLDQLRKIQSGERSADPKDVQLPAMRAAIAPLKDKDFRDVVTHIAGELAGP